MLDEGLAQRQQWPIGECRREEEEVGGEDGAWGRRRGERGRGEGEGGEGERGRGRE